MKKGRVMKQLDDIKQMMFEGEVAKAAEELEVWLKEKPEDVRAGMLYGVCRQQLGDGSAAAEDSFKEQTRENLRKVLKTFIPEIKLLINENVSENEMVVEKDPSRSEKDSSRYEKLKQTLMPKIIEKLNVVTELLGIIDDVRLPREIMDDLFRLKDNLIEANVPLSQMFISRLVDVVCMYLLDDEESPGEIDEAEAKWLRSRTLLNGRMDIIDKKILKTLKAKSLNSPAVLNYKGNCSKYVERWLYSFRWFTWTAIVGSLGAAAALFLGGTCTLINSIFQFFLPDSAMSAWIGRIASRIGISPEMHIKDLETLQVSLVTVIDVYLFAMVLLIFGVGIYELFINQIDPVDERRNNRPSWLHVTCIDDLKASLGKSILMVLIVTLYKYALNITNSVGAGGANVVSLLHFAGVILLVALSLFLTSLSSSKRKDRHGDGE